jgi:uncharacterized protein YjbI with pentapeptide repeats
VDQDQFDRLSRLSAAGTRRDALRLLVSAAAIGVAAKVGIAEGKKRRKGARKRNRVRGQLADFCTNICLNCANKPIRPGANLSRCDFDDETFLDGLNLASANLSRACFARSELRAATFNGANVSGVCFADADLTGASFRGANVSQAVFCGADLTGADFRGSRVTTAQLACATVGCNTILPNGKPAVSCQADETCCAGVCADLQTDPGNCGSCGNACGVCQTCESGECVAVPDNTVACDGSPLEVDGATVCTTRPGTGICTGGTCNCGSGIPTGTPACLCNGLQINECLEDPPPDTCCRVERICRTGVVNDTTTICVECA